MIDAERVQVLENLLISNIETFLARGGKLIYFAYGDYVWRQWFPWRMIFFRVSVDNRGKKAKFENESVKCF